MLYAKKVIVSWGAKWSIYSGWKLVFSLLINGDADLYTKHIIRLINWSGPLYQSYWRWNGGCIEQWANNGQPEEIQVIQDMHQHHDRVQKKKVKKHDELVTNAMSGVSSAISQTSANISMPLEFWCSNTFQKTPRMVMLTKLMVHLNAGIFWCYQTLALR